MAELNDAERKAGMALKEANKLYHEQPTQARRYLVEIARDALMRAAYETMRRDQGAA
jgi:hypothetical protein